MPKYREHALVENFFDVRSAVYAGRAWLCSEAAKFDYRQTKGALLSALKPQADENILEIGCGTGIWSKIVAKLCKTLTAIDISAEMLDAAKKAANKKNVKFVKCDFLDYRTKKKFDKIFMVRVMESFKNKERAIKNISKMLKHNGKLVIISKTTPGIWDVSPRIRRFFAGIGFFKLRDADMPRVYVKNISAGGLMELLAKNGFSHLSLGFAVLRPPLFKKDDREIPIIAKPLEKAALDFFGFASRIAGRLPMPGSWILYPFSESYVISATRGI
ncbi:MAG: class I SAM-dependent methyltransferase [Candidatus Diapherotrites archaeon]|nr:class I SAM-dependent methyltransferase [Candidatus Diapherotrites archaeon]